jgi:hypothetical protein
MSAGDVTTLELVQWDWFVSCSVAARAASDVFLKRKAWALLRCIARFQHWHFHYLPFALRCESGVDPDHRHFHFLVGSLRHKSQGERFRVMATWNRLLGGTPDRVRGTCRVRLYDPAGGLAGHLAKELNESEARAWTSGQVVVSHAAARIAFRNRGMAAVRRNA